VIERGSVVLVVLDPTRGHEQLGLRPCVVVSDPEVVASQRYPLVGVVPLTTRAGEGALCPQIDAAASGLRQASWAPVDQVRSVDKRRVVQLVGRVADDEVAAIERGLMLFLGMLT
jgi:mRNA interferase MazF